MIDEAIANLPHILAILVVVVAMPLSWLVAALLWWISGSDGAALRGVAIVYTSLALIVTVFGAVFINNGMAEPVLNVRETQLITRGSLLVLSVVPTLLWLRWYRSNGH